MQCMYSGWEVGGGGGVRGEKTKTGRCLFPPAEEGGRLAVYILYREKQVNLAT